MFRKTEPARAFLIVPIALPLWLAPIAPAGAVPVAVPYALSAALWIGPIALVSGLAVSLGWAYALRREVKRRRLAETQLTRAKDRAERLARARQDLLVVAAHEVRAPVHAITATVNRLSQLVREPAQRELVRMTRRSVEALTEFVNNVLDLSKNEAGELTLSPRPGDLAALIREITAGFAPVAAERGNVLTFQPEGAIPGCLHFDPMRVRQIVTNLVSNAIKFTEGGEISVALAAATGRSGSRTCEARITVSDHGIGILPDQRRQLFEPYGQFASGAASRFGGIGLGLAICKRLAEAMGGSIEIASEWRKGTSAIVRLSLGACEVQEVAGSDRGQPPRVLIADGDRVQQIVLTTTLRQLGIDSDVADDADQALELWRERRHDLVLVDCSMPGTEGLALARRLIEEGGSTVRVIGVSADRHLITRAIAAGISAMVSEPVCEAHLQDAIAAAMGRRSHGTVANGVR
jgi:signal transduction histidine kinase/ActR/RegA family two-component response regulator